MLSVCVTDCFSVSLSASRYSVDVHYLYFFIKRGACAAREGHRHALAPTLRPPDDAHRPLQECHTQSIFVPARDGCIDLVVVELGANICEIK